MRSRRLHRLVGCAILVTGCNPEVVVERSDGTAAPFTADNLPLIPDDDTHPTDRDVDLADDLTIQGDGTPLSVAESPTTNQSSPAIPAAIAIDRDSINFGKGRPPLERDTYLLAAATDIKMWLAEEFEPAFGVPFEPLRGEIYAGYPQRTAPIPGCGEDEITTYRDLSRFIAFYCPVGDFIAYDDGEGGLLAQLSDEYGPAPIAVVLVHEYGHALQQRTGALNLQLPTVVTEQQADCVAGAWTGRAAAGMAPGVSFKEDDIRSALLTVIQIQDPIGLHPASDGGHGSGFDRVGAFQTGFTEGLNRCAELIESPLPLTPLSFLSWKDLYSGGDAVFGLDRGELFGFLPTDLNLFYDVDLVEFFPGFNPLIIIPTQNVSEVTCVTTFGRYADGSVLCPFNDAVYLNMPVLRDLYDAVGDFAPGFLLGQMWAEAAQQGVNSPLTGKERQLLNDCLTGAWVRSMTPQLNANGSFVYDQGRVRIPVEARSPQRSAFISPNDLTEAIQTAILISDLAVTTDTIGSAFEKVNAFRLGALNGVNACI